MADHNDPVLNVMFTSSNFADGDQMVDASLADPNDRGREGAFIPYVSQRSAEEATRRAVAEAVQRATDQTDGAMMTLESALTAERAKVAATEDQARAAREEASRAWAILTSEHWMQARAEGSLVMAAEASVAKSAGLVALLREARSELNMIGSYVNDPSHVWPNAGLKITAKAYAALVKEIDAALVAAGEA